MSKIDVTYHNLLDKILQEGYTYEDPNRKDVNRLEILSHTFRHEFKDGFPAISTKKLHYKNVVTELIWFLRGDTNIKYLVDNGCNIWNKDAYNYYAKNSHVNSSGHNNTLDEYIDFIKNNDKLYDEEININTKGDLGPVYGKQWRNFNGIDQICKLIQGLKDKPLGTEHIVNSWNVGDLSSMALPPCHYGFQVVVRPLSKIEITMMKQQVIIDVYHKDKSKCVESYLEEEYKNLPKYGFELHWNQRSVDTFLGLPYNIASYATLALILEKITGYKALAIQGNLNKVHLYDNSLDAVKEQLSRDPNKYNNCKLNGYITDYVEWSNRDINKFIEMLTPDDFELKNYESYPHIKVEMLERNE